MAIRDKKNYLTTNPLIKTFIFFLLILSVVLSVVFISYQSEKKTLFKPYLKSKSEKKITNIKTPTITFNYQVKNFSQSKKMFFTFKIENIDSKNKIVYILLDSDDNLATSDAIDLALESDDNIEIKKIIPGDSFNSYPRKIINKNKIIVTGAALSESGQLKIAKPKSNFIKLHLKVKNPQKKSSIKVNQIRTKIFFQGEDITNIEKSFKEILF
jgi:hypothetical protein